MRVLSKFFLLLLLSLSGFALSAQEIEVDPIESLPQTINWLSWEEAMEIQPSSEKKMLLFIYTDWCTLCRRMDERAFKDESLSAYINASFIPVRLNAESRETLIYQGEEYTYTRKGKLGYHQLAATLLDGRLSFPQLVVMDVDQTIIQSIAGYQTPIQMEQICTYFGQDLYEETPWSAFRRNFQPQFITDE